jgi:hypothetical protein
VAGSSRAAISRPITSSAVPTGEDGQGDADQVGHCAVGKIKPGSHGGDRGQRMRRVTAARREPHGDGNRDTPEVGGPRQLRRGRGSGKRAGVETTISVDSSITGMQTAEQGHVLVDQLDQLVGAVELAHCHIDSSSSPMRLARRRYKQPSQPS